jgi:very-short-patch-repair endonuclease
VKKTTHNHHHYESLMREILKEYFPGEFIEQRWLRAGDRNCRPDFVHRKSNIVVEVDGPYHQFTKSEDRERRKALNRKGKFEKRFKNEDLLKPSAASAIAMEIQEAIDNRPTKRNRVGAVKA